MYKNRYYDGLDRLTAITQRIVIVAKPKIVLFHTQTQYSYQALISVCTITTPGTTQNKNLCNENWSNLQYFRYLDRYLKWEETTIFKQTSKLNKVILLVKQCLLFLLKWFFNGKPTNLNLQTLHQLIVVSCVMCTFADTTLLSNTLH